MDTTRTYNVTGKFNFKVFFGVYTEQDGQMIRSYINDGKPNAVYEILSATTQGGGIRLDIGDVSVVCGWKNSGNFNDGYVFDFEVGASFCIPLSENVNLTLVEHTLTVKAGEGGTVTSAPQAVVP